MSMDTVDDLHQAEDMAGTLAAAVRAVYTTPSDRPEELRRAIALARLRAEEWESYCRSTCGADMVEETGGCDDDCCGCPCHDRGEDPMVVGSFGDELQDLEPEAQMACRHCGQPFGWCSGGGGGGNHVYETAAGPFVYDSVEHRAWGPFVDLADADPFVGSHKELSGCEVFEDLRRFRAVPVYLPADFHGSWPVAR